MSSITCRDRRNRRIYSEKGMIMQKDIMVNHNSTFTKYNIKQLMLNAYRHNIAIPSFNICYLPMLAPIAKALCDMKAFGFMAVAKADLDYFGANSLTAVFKEYSKYAYKQYMSLHVDHIPVVDENGKQIDYMSFIRQAIELGYESVMIDASRLPLHKNIKYTKEVISIAKPHNIAVEAELGAVMGHEKHTLLPYEELFRSKKGFTDIEEAAIFVKETNVDWLSVACGTIHGAIQSSDKDKRKVQARIDINHLMKIKQATNIPLVLHGGSGVSDEYIKAAINNGVSKINISTNLRQPYEAALKEGKTTDQAQDIVYCNTSELLRRIFGDKNSIKTIMPM